jgi:hypothetical protein
MNYSSPLLSSYMPCPCPYIGIQGNDLFFNYPLCGVCIYSAKLASIPSHTREHFHSAIYLVSHSSFHSGIVEDHMCQGRNAVSLGDW